MKRLSGFLQIAFIAALLFFHAASASADEGGSSVWKISKDGRTLFLGGSIHLLREKDFPLPEEFDNAFERSDVLVLEADVEQAAESDEQAQFMAKMMLPVGTILQNVLNADVYERLRAQCAEFGLPIEMLAPFKPAFVVTVLSILQIEQLGFLQQGVDMYYFTKAKEAGKQLAFLESVEEQFGMLASQGDGYENDYVRYSLDEADDMESGIAALVFDWRAGTSASVEASLDEMREKCAILYRELLLSRNAAWMSRLKEYLRDEPVELVIVGVAHLHGSEGLLQSLKEGGYLVEQYRGQR